MLRRVFVRDLHRLVEVAHDDRAAGRGTNDVRPLQAQQQIVELLLYPVRKCCRVRDQHRNRHRVVLELSRQVCSNEVRTGSCVRDDHHLGRARDAVHSHRSEHLALREVDVNVARTGDQVYPLDGLRPIRHGRDRLRSTHAVDGIDACDVRRREDGIRNRAIRTRRRGQDQVLHAGDASRDRCHQDGGRVGGSPAWRIESCPTHRAADQLETRGVALRHLDLSRMEIADARGCELQRCAVSLVNASGGRGQLARRNLELLLAP